MTAIRQTQLLTLQRLGKKVGWPFEGPKPGKRLNPALRFSHQAGCADLGRDSQALAGAEPRENRPSWCQNRWVSKNSQGPLGFGCNHPNFLKRVKRRLQVVYFHLPVFPPPGKKKLNYVHVVIDSF